VREDIGRVVEYFKGRAEVSALFLFGSMAEGRARAESDIDIGVLLRDDRRGRAEYERLRGEYYAASPWFSLRGVDIVILGAAPLFLRYRILKTGRVLFDRDRSRRIGFTARALTEYLDFLPVEEARARAVGERLREGTFGR
jgi:hypothetical protein